MEVTCEPDRTTEIPEFGIAIKASLGSDDSSICIDITQLEYQPTMAAQVRHDIRNHLNSVTVGLRLLKDEYESGELEEANETFDSIQEHLKILNTHEALVRSSK
jgi:hypothetical protein